MELSWQSSDMDKLLQITVYYNYLVPFNSSLFDALHEGSASCRPSGILDREEFYAVILYDFKSGTR
jgi:hypothetical protein